MKNLVVGVFALGLGLAACSDSDGDGSGGAGGIQDAETTSGTGNEGGGDGCAISADGTALCAAIDACDPGKEEECAVELAEERCPDTACLTAYDDWVSCWRDLADADQIPECADYPASCDAKRDVYESCIAGDECETTTPDAQAVCDAAVACDAGNTLLGECLNEAGEERCANPACTGAFDGWLACVKDVAESGDWNTCPDFPEQCDAERLVYLECLGPAACGPGPDADSVCNAVADCEGDFEDCIAGMTSERCGYDESNVCRDLLDGYNSCLAGLAEAGEWDECPGFAEACRNEFDAYAGSCI